MKVDYISLGQRIRKFRLEKGMTQERLSELSGLTPAHFSHIETGNTKVSLPSLVEIASVLDVTLDDLLCNSIVRTKHVSVTEMDNLLFDCTDAEVKALLTIAEAGKKAIRQMKP